MALGLRSVSEERKGELWRGLSQGESSGFSRKFDPNDPCTYSTIRKYKCSLHGDESTGSPVQKCEKTEQLLRKCPGRPVEVVESQTEYTEGDAARSNPKAWDREGDRPLFLPQQPTAPEWPGNIVPRPSLDPEWSHGFRNRGESSNSPTVSVPPILPGRPGGHPGGVFGAFEDFVKETEDMAHSFLQVLGVDGDETNQSGNPFDRWFGGDLFGGHDRRAPQRPEANTTNRPPQSTSQKPDVLDPKDFREV